MRVNLSRFDLGSLGHEYVRRSLAAGKSLARYLLEREDLARGEVYTYLPADTIFKDAQEFHVGKQRPSGEHRQALFEGEDGSQWHIIETPSTRDKLAEIILSYTSRPANGICVLQESIGRASDPAMIRLETEVLVFDDELYYYLPPQCNEASIIKAVKLASSIYPPSVGVLTRTSPAWHLVGGRGEVTSGQLQLIAKQAEILFVDAYDGEGYVFWASPAGK